MRLLLSLILSTLASLIGTFLLRQISAVSGPGDSGRGVNVQVVVVVVPVTGNSANRFGSKTYSLFGGRRRQK